MDYYSDSFKNIIKMIHDTQQIIKPYYGVTQSMPFQASGVINTYIDIAESINPINNEHLKQASGVMSQFNKYTDTIKLFTDNSNLFDSYPTFESSLSNLNDNTISNIQAECFNLNNMIYKGINNISNSQDTYITENIEPDNNSSNSDILKYIYISLVCFTVFLSLNSDLDIDSCQIWTVANIFINLYITKHTKNSNTLNAISLINSTLSPEESKEFLSKYEGLLESIVEESTQQNKFLK